MENYKHVRRAYFVIIAIFLVSPDIRVFPSYTPLIPKNGHTFNAQKSYPRNETPSCFQFHPNLGKVVQFPFRPYFIPGKQIIYYYEN